jgi:hypothetical protein
MRALRRFRQRGLPRSRADIQDFVVNTGEGLAKLLAALRDIAQAGFSGENGPWQGSWRKPHTTAADEVVGLGGGQAT